MKRLDHYWYNQNPVAWLLLPLSLIYCFIASLRKQLFKLGVLSSRRVSVPVVIVGNISVGGTGKTPLLISLARHLCQQGLKPGIISRGYAGKAISWPQIVAMCSDPVQVGDEPVMIARNTGCPVVVGPDRVKDVEVLLDKFDCNVILSDDGLQHYRLQRDIEIVVVDADRLFGNGFCLPAGPLREPEARLKSADMVIYHGAQAEKHAFVLDYDKLNSLNNGDQKTLDAFKGQKVHAIAGIGHPERFFSLLESRGIQLIRHHFPDHYLYTANDLKFNDALPILMTEKDAVKCAQLGVTNGWYLPVTAVLSAAALDQFNTLVKRVCNG